MKFSKLAFCVSLIFCGFVNFASGQEIEPANEWSGVQKNDDLKDKLPKDLQIVDKKSFETVWKSLMKDEKIPTVDFEKNFVYVCSVSGPNRAKIFLSTLNKKGNLVVYTRATKMGGPGFGFVMAQFPRKDIKSVHGHKLRKGSSSEEEKEEKDGVTIKIVGKLAHGVMAIGGETTGTTVTAENMTFELQLSGKEQQKLAEKLNGKKVVASGKLTMKRGVERGNRWIVQVKTLKKKK